MIVSPKFLLGALLLILSGGSSLAQKGILSYSITPPNDDTDIFLISDDGSGSSRLLQHVGRDFGADWSADGSRLVFYSHTMDEACWHIFVVNSDGTNLRQITFLNDTLAGFPAWSPDGVQIVFSKVFPSQNYRSELWRMDSDGGNQRRLMSNGDRGDWSPDGSRIVFCSDADGDHEIYVINADGSNCRQLTFNNANDWNPSWSPDGNSIAFTSDRDGNPEIYSMTSDGADVRRLTSNGLEDNEAHWSPDGSRLAFVSMRDSHYEIYIMKSDGSDQRRLTYSNVHAVSPAWKPQAVTDVQGGEQLPHQCLLLQNYPNPFNPTTAISYQLSAVSVVTLKVYDVLGREVATLLNAVRRPGDHTVQWNGVSYPSGVYYYTLQVRPAEGGKEGDFGSTKKMNLLK